MKRFWEKAEVVAAADSAVAGGNAGYNIMLDGRPLRTPKKNLLHLPGLPLGEAIAAEWNAVEGEVRPQALPLTGIANAGCDIVAADPAGFAERLARYAETDLLCYRADGPEALADLQARHWDPLIAWTDNRHGTRFQVTSGIIHIAQPAGTLQRILTIFQHHPAIELAALSLLVEISGSAILALALSEGAITLSDAFHAATIDELWQEQHWGADKEATEQRAGRQQLFAAAFQFLELARKEGISSQALAN